MTPKLILIAHSFERAQHWAYEHRLERSEWMYPDHVSRLQGLSADNNVFLFLPEYWHRRDSSEIEEIVQLIKSRKP